MRYAIVNTKSLVVQNIVEGDSEGISAVFGKRTDVVPVCLRDDFEHCEAGWHMTDSPELRFVPLDPQRAEACFCHDENLLALATACVAQIERAAAEAAAAAAEPAIAE